MFHSGKCCGCSKDHWMSFYHLREILVGIFLVDFLREILVVFCCPALAELRNNAHLHTTMLQMSLSWLRDLPLALLFVSVILALWLDRNTI